MRIKQDSSLKPQSYINVTVTLYYLLCSYILIESHTIFSHEFYISLPLNFRYSRLAGVYGYHPCDPYFSGFFFLAQLCFVGKNLSHSSQNLFNNNPCSLKILMRSSSLENGVSEKYLED